MNQPNNNKQALLQVDNLSAGYGSVLAIQGITMSIYESEIVALVGSNGAGKTTFLRALSRVILSSGSVTYKGQDLEQMTPEEAFAHGIVQVPEGRQLFDHMTVQDNLLMGAYKRRDKAGIKRDLDMVYGIFPKMADRRKQIAGSMSGGEQQMCAMARALMAAPTLLLVDEMSLGLAPVVVDQLMDVLKQIRSNGVTVLLVEQDIYLALEGSDRGYVMETGHIVHSGESHALINDTEVQRAYLGV